MPKKLSLRKLLLEILNITCNDSVIKSQNSEAFIGEKNDVTNEPLFRGKQED
jgi:hypothetical protein